MAQLGKNITFPIYRDVDGVKTPFHNLVLHKATYESVVMALGDKITGDVVYKDNALDITMQEYIEYKRNPDDATETPVKYILVNPPTIVREGLVSDNSQLNGMTKYSFVFYHPMALLSNLPFADVATTTDETRYLSESKTFNWIGDVRDYVAKLNKNLTGTPFVVRISDTLYDGDEPTEAITTQSDVLSFDNNTIADALKTLYETYEIPYIVDQIDATDTDYASGKRFIILVGKPSNTITDDDGETFVFRLGQGLGLKNSSRTPRNNKIVTRIAGYGSENNIPYGYPQIRWYGNQEWDYTINNDGDDPESYPIYSGIVGGELVHLIKHPFTRTHLMPSIYRTTLFNKISPYKADGTANADYDPDTTLLDYYDADDTYANPCNPSMPSYEIHAFDDIKPQIGDASIEDAFPIDDTVVVNGVFPEADEWDDTMDDDGNYVQSHFVIQLPALSFDLYACAAITEQMNIVMTSGACNGCTFPIKVDWDKYKANFYRSDGTFDPVPHLSALDGHVRDIDLFPVSTDEAYDRTWEKTDIEVVVEKDLNTFGTLMPNRYQHPVAGDTFVITGISQPQEYISAAEAVLDVSMADYMEENNVHYWEYPLKISEHFLATHTDILLQIRPNAVLHFEFAGEVLSLYVKQLTIKYGDKVLPQYDITLTDNIEVTTNSIGQTIDSVGAVTKGLERVGAVVQEMNKAARIKPTGSSTRPVWIDSSKEPQPVDAINVPGYVSSDESVVGKRGVAAFGIADLSVAGSGGGGASVDVVAYDDLSTTDGEDANQVATAYAVARLKEDIGMANIPVFSTSVAYKKGDVVRYGNRGYRFTTNKPAGEWRSSYCDYLEYAALAKPLRIDDSFIDELTLD